MAEKDKDKAERLAGALRENLRKRKARARETTAPTGSDPRSASTSSAPAQAGAQNDGRGD